MRGRSVVAVMLCLGLVAALGPAAEAHLAGTIRGIHYRSIECVDDISGVPGTALGTDPTKPATVTCSALGKRIEILCQNPAGNNVSGNSATQITVSTTDQINHQDITNKKKGIAEKILHISDEPFLDSRFCVNPNWTPINVLVTDVLITVEVKQCTDSSCLTEIITSKEVQACVIPEGYSVENLPPPGTEYICESVSKRHLN
jgi:hypothetical protein